MKFVFDSVQNVQMNMYWSNIIISLHENQVITI